MLLLLRYPGILKWYKNIHKNNPHKCLYCGKTRGKINAHHILGKAAFPEFATHLNNWILLCRTCHKLIHRTSKMLPQTIERKKQILLLCLNKIKGTILYGIYKNANIVYHTEVDMATKKEIKLPADNSKQKKIFEYNDIKFDSNLLIFFYKWCLLALDNNLIKSFIYHPLSYILSLAKVYNGKKILQPHKYTPDFIIKLSDTGRIKLQNIFKVLIGDDPCTIEIKPTYSPYGSIEEFSINRKWMYLKYNIFIDKVLVDSFFQKTWCPLLCRYTLKTKKIRDKYKYCINIKLFIEKQHRGKK